MSKTGNRSQSEVVLFVFITGLLLGGVGLSLTSLLVPNWAYVEYTEGIVIVNAGVGMLQRRICDYQGCRTFWFFHEEIDHHPLATFKQEKTTRLLLTCGIASGMVSLGLVWFLWKSKTMVWIKRTFFQVLFLISCAVSAILCLSASILTSANIDATQMGWASMLGGGSGTLMLLAAFLSRFQCRHDPRTSTNANGANARDIVVIKTVMASPLDDRAVFVNFDYNSYYCVGGGASDHTDTDTDEEKKQPLP